MVKYIRTFYNTKLQIAMYAELYRIFSLKVNFQCGFCVCVHDVGILNARLICLGSTSEAAFSFLFFGFATLRKRNTLIEFSLTFRLPAISSDSF